MSKDKIKKYCKGCEESFYVHQYRKDTAIFCSQKCKGNSQKGIDMFKGMDKVWLKGNNFAKGSCGSNTSFKKGQTPWNKGIKYEAVTGHKNPNWKGGVTSINEKERKSLSYKGWRTSVFMRDNHTCQMCGSSKSGTLNADHILPFSMFKDSRFDIGNGQTLCQSCHKTTYSYLNPSMVDRKTLIAIREN